MSFYTNLSKYIQSLSKIYKSSNKQHQRDEVIRLRRELESIAIPNDLKECLEQLQELRQALNKLDIIIQLNNKDKGIRKFYWSIRLNLMTHYYNRLFYFSPNLFKDDPKENLYNTVVLKHDNAMSIMHYWRKLTFLLRNPALDSKRMYEHYVRLFKSYGPESARRFYRYVCFIVDYYNKDAITSVISNLTMHQLKRVILTMDKYYKDEYRFVQNIELVKTTYIDTETNVTSEAVCREMLFDLSLPRTKLEALKAESIKRRKEEKRLKQKSKTRDRVVKPNRKPTSKQNKPKKVTPAFLGDYVLKDKPPIGRLSVSKTKSLNEVKVVIKKRRTLTKEQIDAMQRDIENAKKGLE